jgi:predicted nucleotidyltransferase
MAALVIKYPINMGKMDYKSKLASLADEFNLQVIYAFGSRAKEIFNTVHQKKHLPPASKSDLDIGIKPEKPLSVQEKVKIAIFFEDLFDVPKADVIEISEAPITLALEIVQGELLYARDENYEAEYQLYIMSRAADLMPYERQKHKMIVGIEK